MMVTLLIHRMKAGCFIRIHVHTGHKELCGVYGPVASLGKKSEACHPAWFYTTLAEISNGKRRTSVCQQRHDRTRYGEDIGIPIRKADQLQAKRQAVIFEHRE
jgi:hypothetical protein